MKKTLLGMVAVLGFGLASAQSISFDKTVFDYGKVSAGSDGHRYFTVKNTGDKPLILTEVKPACGCTTPEWSKDPIMPGKTGEIKVHYNTAGLGAFQKSIDVYSNDPTNGRSVIFIKGNVDPNAAEPAVQNANEKSAVAKQTGVNQNAKATATPKKKVVKKKVTAKK